MYVDYWNVAIKRTKIRPIEKHGCPLGPVRIIYGNHLFFPKLGLRFSKKALRPSLASSVI